MFIRHETIEKNAILMLVLTLLTVSIGGLVQIIPLFTIESTIERVEGVRPYTPLELAGRNIYIREGCYLCHSQQVRPFKDEVERYGHYSLAAESIYDRPFQWGSKRTGPDLARVGGKYSDDWHRDHLRSPKSVVPGTVMPAYPWLAATELDFKHIADDMKVNANLGVPYTKEMIEAAELPPLLSLCEIRHLAGLEGCLGMDGDDRNGFGFSHPNGFGQITADRRDVAADRLITLRGELGLQPTAQQITATLE